MLGGTENLILPGGPLVAGFAAGMLHVVSGPDHVAALAPLAVRNRLHAMRTGAVWGAGHGTGVLILGSLGIFARHLIDINFLSRWSEWFVGMMLLAIGLWAARQTFILHRQGFGRTKRGSLISSSSFSSLPTEPLSPSEKGKVQLRVRPSSQHVEVDLSPAEKGEKVQLRDDTAAAAPKHAGSTAFGVGVLHGAAGVIFGCSHLSNERRRLLIRLHRRYRRAKSNSLPHGHKLGSGNNHRNMVDFEDSRIRFCL
mmetsp:Transcript_14678/g.20267  ORF Transcript_14678/g.20267 Transcript_14678/m.20267 type:complete len:254 (+) Transcript_14678:247-1008(+)